VRFGAWIVPTGQEMIPGRVVKKAKKKKRKKKLKDFITGIFAQTTHVALPHQSCHVKWGPGRIKPCQVSSKSVLGLWLREGSKSAIFLVKK